MARKELSISASYVPTWGVWEGIREIIQNAKDEEDQHGSKMSIRHSGTTLTVKNSGANLTTDALLLGETSKSKSPELRGVFGEGLDLGLLALVRAGLNVKIYTPTEIWTPAIESSADYNGTKVLVVNTRKRRAGGLDVQFQIEGLEKEDWEEMKKRFFFLTPAKPKDYVSAQLGKLLVGKQYAGQLFVKGIFVEQRSDLHYGYDLDFVELDRDRKMVDPWMLQYHIAEIIQEVQCSKPSVMTMTPYQLLKDGSFESTNIGLSSSAKGYSETLQSIAKEFEAEYGENAIPVISIAESKELSHYGKLGVVVPSRLKIAIEKTKGTFTSIKEALSKQPIKTYSWNELTPEQQTNLTSAASWLDPVLLDYSPILNHINVCDFRDPKLQGLADFSEGTIQISSKVLESAFDVLLVIIHEVAHLISASGDGEKGHVEAIEELWKGVFISKHKASKETQNN